MLDDFVVILADQRSEQGGLWRFDTELTQRTDRAHRSSAQFPHGLLDFCTLFHTPSGWAWEITSALLERDEIWRNREIPFCGVM